MKNILVLNAGSATLKYKLFREEIILAEGKIEASGEDKIVAAAEKIIGEWQKFGIDTVGHRVVHGGSRFTGPTVVTPEVLSELRALSALDPLHNPTEVAVIEAALRLLPGVPSVAVFDTAFHQTLPEVAWRYALPRELSDRLGLRKYGFHGISYQYVAAALPQFSRLIALHLGSGASVCAIKNGKSIDTSMGLTPLEGLVMGTRSGDVDPGLLLYLLRTQKMTPDALDDLLNHESGLLGLSGLSADVRILERAATTGDARAALALDAFAYRVRKYVGAYAVALEGIDAIAFTGGIGENSPKMRERICGPLAFLGLRLDPERNARTGREPGSISADDSSVQVDVLAADEEGQIARMIAPQEEQP